MCPHRAHLRRCSHQPRSARHSKHPVPDGFAFTSMPSSHCFMAVLVRLSALKRDTHFRRPTLRHRGPTPNTRGVRGDSPPLPSATIPRATVSRMAGSKNFGGLFAFKQTRAAAQRRAERERTTQPRVRANERSKARASRTDARIKDNERTEDAAGCFKSDDGHCRSGIRLARQPLRRGPEAA